MIVQKDFLQRVKKHFNLNIYEVKIWTALLSRGVATAGALSDIADVPRSRSYDVLESLEKKGFVIMKLGKPIKYIAVKPEEILIRMQKHILDDSENKVTAMEEVKVTDTFKELELLYKQGVERIEATDISGAIVGRTNIYTYIKALIENAQKQIIIVTTGKGFSRKADVLKNGVRRAKGRGVKITFVAPLTKQHEPDKKRLEEFAEILHCDKMKGRFVIVDGKELVFMTATDEKDLHPSYDTAVWVKSPYFVKAFELLFRQIL